MRYSTILTSIKEALNSKQSKGHVAYRGITTNAVATELFIDAIPSRRLVPALDSTTLLNCRMVAHGSAAISLFSNRKVLIRHTAAGVLSVVDLDATTGGANDVEPANAVAAASGAVVASVPVIPNTGTNSVAFSVVAATATTPAYIAVTATGTASTTIYWEVEIEYVEAGPRG